MKRFLTSLSLLSSLAAASVLGGACSMQFETASLASDRGGDNFAGTGPEVEPPPTGGGAGGNTGDITFPSPNPAPDGNTSYTELCGAGCMSGESALGCSVAMNPEDGAPLVSCQIVPTPNGASAQCLTPGFSQTGDPCTRASDCVQGHGCALTGSSVGSCRPYCCGAVAACPEDTYCAPAPMADDTLNAAPLAIPVCIPATECTLLDDTSCPAGQTCTLVREDGTTSCVDPGAGYLDDPCPCAAGYLCVAAFKKCLALCHTGGSDCPDGMFCQGGADSFPDGIGVCVK
ncbi:hypothetical protein [Polyangium spumosum]|uniref:Dickkopf N-terminal cysteine-rich domain-containing protein n=1 Tax=Polyangium spumosum TaxID=889282 RepID=A0A6N7PXU7_9BACT|nr:hypothetical protein [Polyangium spumosum]MRG96823.1 hypothetical protein [Polyangium spumosum]